MTKISVITINRNNASGLSSTLESVARQTIRPELVVIDGASTDDSVEKVRSFGQLITSWVSEPDNGIYQAQNKGIRRCSGDYLLFLNSGDVFAATDVLQKTQTHLKADICYGDLLVSRNGTSTINVAPEKLTVDHMLNNTVWHPSAFIRRELFSKVGFYDESFSLAGDYEFFVRCYLRADVTFAHVPSVVAVFDGHGSSHDPANTHTIAAERERAWRINARPELLAALRTYNRIERSRYFPLISWIEKLRGKKL